MHFGRIFTAVALLTCGLWAQDTPQEKQLFREMNASRQQEGLAPLRWDDRLGQAAREHTQKMIASHTLAHELPGEPQVGPRLAATGIRFNHSGENVGFNSDFDGLHPEWMKSPGHRKNILDPNYTVAGIGVMQASDGVWWATTDFAHAVPQRTAAQAEDMAAQSFVALRQKQRRRPLERIDNPKLQAIACGMAKTGKLDPRQALRLPDVRNAVAYNNSRPDELPRPAQDAAAQPYYSKFAVGACFTGDQPNNPGGTFYVVMAFY
jgi:hypothetical protein